jgi:putative oxidoreductase
MNLARLESLAYAALRIVAGGLFACHGMQKILGWFTTSSRPALGSQAWVGGLIELLCGLLIAVGLFTRPAAFLASGTMAVAYIQFHWKLNLADWKWLPIVNRGELAAVYCFLFLFFSARGAGAASLDRRLRGR